MINDAQLSQAAESVLRLVEMIQDPDLKNVCLEYAQVLREGVTSEAMNKADVDESLLSVAKFMGLSAEIGKVSCTDMAVALLIAYSLGYQCRDNESKKLDVWEKSIPQTGEDNGR